MNGKNRISERKERKQDFRFLGGNLKSNQLSSWDFGTNDAKGYLFAVLRCVILLNKREYD